MAINSTNKQQQGKWQWLQPPEGRCGRCSLSADCYVIPQLPPAWEMANDILIFYIGGDGPRCFGGKCWGYS